MPRTPKVVDTNVCVTSNRKNGESLRCASRCARELNSIVKRGLLVIDDGDAIFGEYKRYLSFSGQPGAGDIFFKWLFDNRYRPERVEHVKLQRHQDRPEEYLDFPDSPSLSGFDRGDRVFVALARAHASRPPILTAVDSDYWHHRAALAEYGVDVVHICGHQDYKPAS